MRRWLIIRDILGNHFKYLKHSDIAIQFDEWIERNDDYVILRSGITILTLKKPENVIEEGEIV